MKGPGEPTEKDAMGIKGERGKTGKGIGIEMDRESHQSNMELESIRTVLIFDYALQAYLFRG